jgi:hypothetical protein
VALSVFDDKARQPTEADLARALRGSFVFWNELKERIELRFTLLTSNGDLPVRHMVGDCASSTKSESFFTCITLGLLDTFKQEQDEGNIRKQESSRRVNLTRTLSLPQGELRTK